MLDVERLRSEMRGDFAFHAILQMARNPEYLRAALESWEKSWCESARHKLMTSSGMCAAQDVKQEVEEYMQKLNGK